MTSLRLILLALVALVGGDPYARAESCNQTLSTGEDVDSAAAAVPNGLVWTICLNDGIYSGSAVNFANIARTNGVITIRSSNGTYTSSSSTLNGATIHNSDYLTFLNLKLTDIDVGSESRPSCPTHITFKDSTFIAGAPGLQFVELTACPPQHNLVDHVSFAGVNFAYGDGRLAIRGPINTMQIANSYFGDNGYGDGIQLTSAGPNITIGPNNHFNGVRQAYCDANGGAHCDAIQCNPGGCQQGIRIWGNLCEMSDFCLMAPDGSTGLIYERNVANNCGLTLNSQRNIGSIQIGKNRGPMNNAIVRHNTILCTNVGLSGDDALWQNNILYNGQLDTRSGGPCARCTQQFTYYRLAADATASPGTNESVRTVTWLGGIRWPSLPASPSGWQLAVGSAGKNAGSDGLDIGTTHYGERMAAGRFQLRDPIFHAPTGPTVEPVVFK